MEKQFIPYELALKLKELGFKEECLDFYSNENNLLFHNGKINKESVHIGSGISAPLWQQAFDWFRENHELYYFEDHRCNSHDITSRSYWFGIKRFRKAPFGQYVEVGTIQLGCFKTYEEGRHACLEKLIEIVQQKTN